MTKRIGGLFDLWDRMCPIDQIEGVLKENRSGQRMTNSSTLKNCLSQAQFYGDTGDFFVKIRGWGIAIDPLK